MSACAASTLQKRFGHALHLGIAEHGKILALEGRHHEALSHYREALRLAQAAGAPEIMARHYLHCVLDSLERLGAFAEAAELCKRAVDALPEQTSSAFGAVDRACLLERQGVAELYRGRVAEAKERFEAATVAAGAVELPLAAQVLDWLARGYSVTPERLGEAQRRHRYFTVRSDTVDRGRAVPLPMVPKGARNARP